MTTDSSSDSSSGAESDNDENSEYVNYFFYTKVVYLFLHGFYIKLFPVQASSTCSTADSFKTRAARVPKLPYQTKEKLLPPRICDLFNSQSLQDAASKLQEKDVSSRKNHYYINYLDRKIGFF